MTYGMIEESPGRMLFDITPICRPVDARSISVGLWSGYGIVHVKALPPVPVSTTSVGSMWVGVVLSELGTNSAGLAICIIVCVSNDKLQQYYSPHF